MELLPHLFHTLLLTSRDVLPIAAVIFGFQLLVIRKPIPNLKRVLIGFLYVLFGLALFLVGLEEALFPLGKVMARQLTDPVFLYGGIEQLAGEIRWLDYLWVYLFAAAIGFATTIAEPSLLAVAIKAQEVSGGTIGIWGLRIAVALGVAAGIALGTFRIVTGTPLYYYIIAGYLFVIVQTLFAGRGDHLDGDCAAGDGAGAGTGFHRTRTQSRTGWLRPDCLCQPVSHHHGAGLCAAEPVAEQRLLNR